MPMTGHWLYLFIILIIALIVFGPSRLPEIGSGLGRAIREFKHATTEAKEDLRNAVRDEPSAPVAVAAPTADPAAGPYAAPVQESHGA